MRVHELLKDVGAREMGVVREVKVTGLCYDSRRVRPGDMFFGLAGLRQDGQDFVREALAGGAVAAVVGPESEIRDPRVVRVEEPRKVLAQAAAAFHGHPSRRLKIVAVTGTNGKTTTTYLVEGILRAAGMTAGLIGTTGYQLGDETRPADFTTPQAPELQGLLREMLERRVEGAALEISSHALVQRRAFGLECDVSVFTNLSHEHLDYHGTLEAYLDAKLMLFDGRNAPQSSKSTVTVVNLDDLAAERVVKAARGRGARVVTYGKSIEADVAIKEIAAERRGLRFTVRESDRSGEIRLPLLGVFNAWNAAAAYAATRALGIAPEVAVTGLEQARRVPGRLERIDEGQPFEVVVDYAHTPDALSAALAAMRGHTRGRLLLVFGCGGDRDRAKRPVMGRVAADASDLAWITSDNPRSEPPEAIAAAIARGAPDGRFRTELDRRAAIEQALLEARPGDAVLIAGKGHETTQTIGERVLPFDDRRVAGEWLRRRAEEWR